MEKTLSKLFERINGTHNYTKSNAFDIMQCLQGRYEL